MYTHNNAFVYDFKVYGRKMILPEAEFSTCQAVSSANPDAENGSYNING